MDQCAASRAELQVLECGDRQKVVFGERH
jgi:hypothetical protein